MFVLDSFVPSKHIAAAWSLFKLRPNHIGPMMRVRRSSDSALGDLYYDTSDKLSMASVVVPVAGGAPTTLGAWHGGGSVHKVDFADLSGRGVSLLTATAANQPKIVNAGALITNLSPPLVAYDGVTNKSIRSFTRVQPHSLIISGSCPNNDPIVPVMVDGLPSGQGSSPADSSSNFVVGGAVKMQAYSGASLVNNTHDDRGLYGTYIIIFDGAQSQIWRAGVLIAEGNAGTTPAGDIRFGINWQGAVHSNTSFHTAICARGRVPDPAGLSQAIMALT